MDLDELIPSWYRREWHSIATDQPPERLLPAVEELTWGEVRLFRTLMSARFPRYGERFPPDEPVLGWFQDVGFAVLARTSRALVLGLVQSVGGDAEARPVTSAAAFRAFSDPGHVKIALAFSCEPFALVTETRVAPTDEQSRRAFRWYWMVVRPFSGVIRREWLRAVRRRVASADDGFHHPRG
jgi:hypothetical protein